MKIEDRPLGDRGEAGGSLGGSDERTPVEVGESLRDSDGTAGTSSQEMDGSSGESTEGLDMVGDLDETSTGAEREGPPRAPPPPSRALVLARGVVVGLAGLWVAVLAVVFALRVGFPLELEWMEGGSLQQAWRMQRGLPIYGPPSPDFVPFLYTPLYPALLAALGKILPLGLALARSISVLSVAATGAGLWRLVRYEGKSTTHAAAAVGLFYSGYVFGFRWLDVARGDALFLALLVWGLALLRESEGDRRRAVLAGVLIALAFWTKQTAAIFVLASGVVGLLIAPRQVWLYAATIALLCGGGVLVGQALTDDWLWVWIYETHQTHAFNAERFETKTWGMFLHAAPFLAGLTVVLGAAGFALFWRRLGEALGRLRARADTRIVATGKAAVGELWAGLRAARGVLYWSGLAAAGLLVSALGYSTQYAEPNAFLPGICLGAACFAVALPDARPRGARTAASPRLRRGLEIACLLAVAAQMLFALLVEPEYQPIQTRGVRAGLGHSYAWQDPWRTIPTRDQREQAAALRARLLARASQAAQAEGGEILALHRPWWSILAGGSGHVGAMGINDVPEADREALQAALISDLGSGRFDGVWIEGSVPQWLRRPLARWTVGARLWGPARVRPLTGWMSVAGMVSPWRGEQLFLVPARAREVPVGAEVIADFETGRLDGFEVVSGRGFGRSAARSMQRGLPPVGPHGGARLVSSARSGPRLAGRGELRSPVFQLRAGGAVAVWLGTSGTSVGLAAQLIREDDGSLVVDLPLPRTHFDLAPVRWAVPEGLGGVAVRLHLVDESADAALFADDLWVL